MPDKFFFPIFAETKKLNAMKHYRGYNFRLLLFIVASFLMPIAFLSGAPYALTAIIIVWFISALALGGRVFDAAHEAWKKKPPFDDEYDYL